MNILITYIDRKELTVCIFQIIKYLLLEYCRFTISVNTLLMHKNTRLKPGYL